MHLYNRVIIQCGEMRTCKQTLLREWQLVKSHLRHTHSHAHTHTHTHGCMDPLEQVSQGPEARDQDLKAPGAQCESKIRGISGPQMGRAAGKGMESGWKARTMENTSFKRRGQG